MIVTNSTLAEHFWQTGKLDCPVLDFHAHMHQNAGLYFPYIDAAGMAHTMDRCNTRWTLFCSHTAMKDPFEGEKIQQQTVREFPDHFRAYHAVISTYPDIDRAIRTIEDNPGVYVGFKFHPDGCSVPLTNPVHAPYLEYLNDKHLITLLHTWGKSPNDGVDEVAAVAEKYPNVDFICGHSFFDDFDYASRRLKGLDNIYYELTAVPIRRGFIEEICEKVGSDRLLFGSDMPWFGTAHSIGCVLAADISDEDRENIFWRSGAKLLKRFSWFTMEPRTQKNQ